MKLSPKQIRAFQVTILDYYRRHGRKFPWRRTQNPYEILVSEVMLQQTQVDRVIPKYREWIKQFPNPETLAKAPLKRVLQAWSGLGYNRRALYLKRAAEVIVREHGGEVPRDVEKLRAFSGVGPYTVAAILAFAWNEPTVFIETNIRTVYLHFFFKNRKKVRDEEILKIIKITTPSPISPSKEGERKRRHSNILKNVGMSVREWYNALMDYGAMLKKTTGNSNTRSAHYAKQKKFAGSRREFRGAVLRRASEKGSISSGEFSSQKWSAEDVIASLVREGFLKKQGSRFTFA